MATALETATALSSQFSRGLEMGARGEKNKLIQAERDLRNAQSQARQFRSDQFRIAEERRARSRENRAQQTFDLNMLQAQQDVHTKILKDDRESRASFIEPFFDVLDSTKASFYNEDSEFFDDVGWQTYLQIMHNMIKGQATPGIPPEIPQGTEGTQVMAPNRQGMSLPSGTNVQAILGSRNFAEAASIIAPELQSRLVATLDTTTHKAIGETRRRGDAKSAQQNRFPFEVNREGEVTGSTAKLYKKPSGLYGLHPSPTVGPKAYVARPAEEVQHDVHWSGQLEKFKLESDLSYGPTRPPGFGNFPVPIVYNSGRHDSQGRPITHKSGNVSEGVIGKRLTNWVKSYHEIGTAFEKKAKIAESKDWREAEAYLNALDDPQKAYFFWVLMTEGKDGRNQIDKGFKIGRAALPERWEKYFDFEDVGISGGRTFEIMTPKQGTIASLRGMVAGVEEGGITKEDLTKQALKYGRAFLVEQDHNANYPSGDPTKLLSLRIRTGIQSPYTGMFLGKVIEGEIAERKGPQTVMEQMIELRKAELAAEERTP